MSAALLIQSIVRQAATLLTQLENTGHVRGPLSPITTQVFFELAQELERIGVTRRVSADMFGLGVRAYGRKLQRAAATVTGVGPALRRKVLEYIRAGQVVARSEVFAHFPHIDEEQLHSILRDLCESALVFALGSGDRTAYRATTGDEAAALAHKYIGSDYVEVSSDSMNSGRSPILVNAAGEGTYAVAVWQGHPLEQDAIDILRQLRQMLAELRARVLEVGQGRPQSQRRPRIASPSP